MITDNTVMKYGKYRGNLMKDIPTNYLIEFHRGNHKNGFMNGLDFSDLLRYVSGRIKTIIPPSLVRPLGSVINDRVNAAINSLCPKEFFITAGDAKYRLDYIRRMKEQYGHVGRIPIRSYNCEYCGYWHLTSQVVRGVDAVIEDVSDVDESYEPMLKDKWLKLMGE